MGQCDMRGAQTGVACRVAEADARLQKQVKTRFGTKQGPGESMRRRCQVAICICLGVFLAGCPKGNQNYTAGMHAEDLQDFDAAVDQYMKATKVDPHNANFKIKLNQARFEASQQHVHKGMKLLEKSDLESALSEFQRAQVYDPSSSVADQEVKKTLELIGERAAANQAAEEPLVENGEPVMASAPPEIKPMSRAPITLKMSSDVKVVFDTIGKLAGLTVIYDPDLQQKRISTELNNVTLEQALDIVCLESKTFWKPVTENIIIVVPDQAQKRRD